MVNKEGMMERKHLAIEVMATPWGKFWRVKEQTHVGADFGCGCNTFEYMGFTIRSVFCPEAALSTALVRGTCESNDHFVLPVISDGWLDRFRAAVRAYNKHFESDELDMARRDFGVEVIE